MNRLVRAGCLVAAVVPAVVVLALVVLHGVNVPYWDQWELVGPLTRLRSGTLGWSDIFDQHNEHRMVFPKLVMLGLATLTGWNVKAEMLAGVLMAAASFGMLVALARPVLCDASQPLRAWAIVTISVLMFSIAQRENWLWGWQIQWFITVLAATSAIALATWSLGSARPFAYVAGAAAAAVVCQFSVASGAIIWICAAMILAFHPRRGPVLLLWLAAAVVALAVFLAGYQRQPPQTFLYPELDQRLSFLLYVSNYLAGPLSRHASNGVAAGAAFIVLAAVAVTRHRRAPQLFLPWVALGAFAGANAILTAVGRISLGPDHGLASRYITVSLLLSVALVPLSILVLRGRPERPWMQVMRGVGIAGAILLTVLPIRRDIREWKEARRLSAPMIEGRSCLLAITTATDDCLKLLYPDPATVRMREPQLRAFGWSGFSSR